MALKIATGFALPIDVAGESTAILAKKGAGKSNTAKVIVEEMLDHGGVQVIALDPIGHWWSLRAGANGKPGGGYPVAVFGGMHGDLPLEETAGKLLAQTAVESGQSIVLDVSGLDSNGAMQRFVYEFLEELYKLKQKTPTPLLLVLEEADEFAPQDPKGANVPRMVGAANRISKRGRGRGIGMLYVTQRSAALNKNVLDQADTLIVMRTIGPRDRTAIEGWVKHQDAAGMDQVLPSLPGLATGEAWIWTPERSLLERVKIRKARTFDSSQTPKPGETAIVADVKPIDVDKLGAAIKATVERVKENDPAELRKRLAALQRELAKRPTETTTVEIERVVEVPVLNGNVGQLQAAVDAMQEVAERLTATGELVLTSARELSTAIAAVTAPAARRAPVPKPTPRPAAARPPVARPAPAPAPAEEGDFRPSKSQQRILDALSWFEWIGIDAPARPALAFIAGTRPTSGGFKNNLGALRTAALIAYPAGSRVQLLAAGRSLSAALSETPTDEALQEAVLAAVTGSQAAIVRALLDTFPDPLSRDELAAAVGVPTTSGGFKNNLGALRTLELIDYPSPGYVVALPVLFPVSEGDRG
ncbi:MAG TPA: DUF87 domain-containing protein [Gaiellaceae bacterium]